MSPCDFRGLCTTVEKNRRLLFDPENSRRIVRVVPRRAVSVVACLLPEMLGDHGSNLMPYSVAAVMLLTRGTICAQLV